MAHPTLCVIFFVSERADEASSTFAALERVLGCEGRLTLVHATETPVMADMARRARGAGWGSTAKAEALVW